jgi:diguanylate cyclase (GGDEF)-like protein/PAS domain S-box-containing protein
VAARACLDLQRHPENADDGNRMALGVDLRRGIDRWLLARRGLRAGAVGILRDAPRVVGGSAALAVAYFVVGRLALELASVAGGVAPIWFPSGLALAALVVFGPRFAPGVLVGEFAVDAAHGLPPTAALVMACGDVAEILLAVHLLRRFRFDGRLARLRDVGGLLVVAGMASLVGATVGTLALAQAGAIDDGWRSSWLLWWAGDATGMLIVTPLLLATVMTTWRRPRWSTVVEALALAATLIAVLAVALEGENGHAFVIVPALVWAALRFGPPGGALAVAVSSGAVAWYTGIGRGPFNDGSPVANLILAQAFSATAALMTLSLAAVAAERKAAVAATEEAARAELRATVEQYRALARSIPRGFVTLFDRDLRFVIAEGEGLAHLGYTSASLQGRTPQEVLPEGEAVAGRWVQALRGEHSVWEREDGGRTFQLVAGPVRDADGAITAGVVVGIDVSDKKLAEARLRLREAELEALHDLAVAVAAGGDPIGIFSAIAHRVAVLFGVDNAAVVRFTANGEGQILGLSTQRPTPFLEGTVEPLVAHSATAIVYGTGQGAYVDGYDGRIDADRLAGATAGAAAPIQVGGGLWGVLAVSSSDAGLIGPTIVNRLTAFADLVSVAVGNAALMARLIDEATTDALTGLANRREFERELQAAFSRAQRHDTQVGIVVLDVDHFKAINDQYGHDIGDDVLRQVASRLETTIRAYDRLARWGGEEFIVLLGDGGDEALERVADALVDAVRAEPFTTPIGAIRATASAGTAIGDADTTPEALIERADHAMYAAKRRGRDRVVRAPWS